MNVQHKREKIIALAAKVDQYRKALKKLEAELDAELSKTESTAASAPSGVAPKKSKRAVQGSLPQRIMTRFANEPDKTFNFNELRDLTDAIPTLRSTLSRLVTGGKLRKAGFGKYQLNT
jgi:hypothetical protein